MPCLSGEGDKLAVFVETFEAIFCDVESRASQTKKEQRPISPAVVRALVAARKSSPEMRRSELLVSERKTTKCQKV